MKSFVIVISFLVLSVFQVKGQNTRSDTLVRYVGKINLSISHNAHDLDKLDKSTLARVLARRTKILLELIPYMALKAKPTQDVRNMEIPMTKKRLKNAEKQEKVKTKSLSHLYETMKRINVYADKKDLIKQIENVDLWIVHIVDFINSDTPTKYVD